MANQPAEPHPKPDQPNAQAALVGVGYSSSQPNYSSSQPTAPWPQSWPTKTYDNDLIQVLSLIAGAIALETPSKLGHVDAQASSVNIAKQAEAMFLRYGGKKWHDEPVVHTGEG